MKYTRKITSKFVILAMLANGVLCFCNVGASEAGGTTSPIDPQSAHQHAHENTSASDCHGEQSDNSQTVHGHGLCDDCDSAEAISADTGVKGVNPDKSPTEYLAVFDVSATTYRLSGEITPHSSPPRLSGGSTPVALFDRLLN